MESRNTPGHSSKFYISDESKIRIIIKGTSSISLHSGIYLLGALINKKKMSWPR